MYWFFFFKKACSLLWGSAWGNLSCRLNGIRCRGWLRCFGTPALEIHPGSSVSIGRGCILRSARCSNMLGLSVPCKIGAGPGASLTIGDQFGASGTTIAACASICIGNRVMIGANSTIADSDFHSLDPEERQLRRQGIRSEPVVIEDDVFIGMNCLILKGVTIGSRSVVAAGSVVVSSLPPDVIAGGNPAKVLRVRK